jgi:uncharacterized lipoprotein NlpE involved in copper resistance
MKKTIFILIAFTFIVVGCNQARKQKQAEGNGQNETITMPDQSYVGLWNTADNPPDDLTIFEISNNEITFELGVFRIIGTDGTAKIEDNKIVFVTDADFSGTMEFDKNSILLTVVKSEFEYIQAGRTFDFTVKMETNIETDEALISVSYADESFFEKYETYEQYDINNEYAHKIAFIPNVPVKDFSWLSLTFEFDDIDGVIYDVEEELYSLEELLPQKPLVVSWVEVGIMSCFGFSYHDKDGEKKYFVGHVGNYGGDEEEYDGPNFIISQFFPLKD